MAGMSLVIVESPTKARTISKILGDKYTVIPSMGHLIDLPAHRLGVAIEKGFEPSFVIISGRNQIMSSLRRQAKDIPTIYVATDPDREGEAIGWHLKERLFKEKKVMRVTFHEITKAAVKESFDHPREFDLNMVEAQLSRRILDRIVGYHLSPFLWKKIVRGLSAGRVQSVALRLIVDRERQIQGFVPREYWEIEAELAKQPDKFLAKLDKIADKKAEVKTQPQAERIVDDLKGKEFIVSEIKKTSKKRNPQPPFITSTLQQESFNKLRFNATKTMIVAQQLYEGIDIGEPAPLGLITYMRTDSTRVAPEAIKEVRSRILKQYGKKYLPEKPNVYKVRKLAQEAHEAIRPSLIDRPAESLKEYLSLEQYKVYDLIYNRFIASQMNPAESLVTTAIINAGDYQFSACGSDLVFDGFTAIYSKIIEDKESDEPDEDQKVNKIPSLNKGDRLDLLRFIPSQHFTKSLPRYSDSSLVKALEEEGIGRPSTYAPIIQTILTRDYARRLKGYFTPTELGMKVCDILVKYFPKIMDIKFTALMEEKLDEIEEGSLKRNSVLEEFYQPFKVSLDFAQTDVKKEVVTTDEACQMCGKPLIVKWGRKGKFLSCCDYPACKFSKSITTGIKCPGENCTGELIERHSRRGIFYGCSSFPKCTYTSKQLPESDSQQKQASPP